MMSSVFQIKRFKLPKKSGKTNRKLFLDKLKLKFKNLTKTSIIY